MPQYLWSQPTNGVHLAVFRYYLKHLDQGTPTDEVVDQAFSLITTALTMKKLERGYPPGQNAHSGAGRRQQPSHSNTVFGLKGPWCVFDLRILEETLFHSVVEQVYSASRKGDFILPLLPMSPNTPKSSRGQTYLSSLKRGGDPCAGTGRSQCLQI